MAQKNLTWNGLNLATPSNGRDGYVLTGHAPEDAQVLEKAIPNTAGRQARVVGRSLSRQTSLQLVFRVQATFDSLGALHNHLKAVEAKKNSTSQPLGTLTYGLYQDANTFTEYNVRLDDWTQSGEIEFAGGKYILMSVAQFSKWSP